MTRWLEMPPTTQKVLLVLLLSPALAWLLSMLAKDLTYIPDLHTVQYVGADACRRCHPDQDQTFRRTFHGTMTTDATDQTVLGAFDGSTLTYMGVRATFTRGQSLGGDRPFRVIFQRGAVTTTMDIERAVGSHRYQQYLAREDDLYIRLPVAWHIGEQRWFHMNAAFLTPDPTLQEDGKVSLEDYGRHVVRWNDNCIFCHNVAPNPGLDPRNARYDTEVAELGIACEACHGPGGEHAARNRNPARRLGVRLMDGPDPTIVNPKRLTPERSAQICGRCHGQRITERIERFLANGDPYVPGDDLALYSAPLWQDTPLDDDSTVFRERFWPDGTPRLTAYEYQGLLMSPCAERGEMTCLDCHAMHGGDPRGQLRPEARGDGACTRCHEDLGNRDSLSTHTAHVPGGSGARCIACHMPRMVYGLVDVHRSHRVEIPNPQAAQELERPDACTLCHVDENRSWATEASARLWPERFGTIRPAAARAAHGTPREVPEMFRILFGGDPVERSVAARMLGRVGPPALPDHLPERLGALFDTMVEDPYPAVRSIAHRSAQALSARHQAPFSRYDATALAPERRRVVARIMAALPAGSVLPPDPGMVQALRAASSQKAIHIGE